MSTGGPLPYLSVSGTEVANAARILSYLRGGLAADMQGHFELGSGDVCGVLYRADGTPSTFVSPAADPAPWYDADEPGSATFLGFLLLDLVGYDGVIYRAVTNKIQGLGGATLSGQERYPRVWKLRGAMISADDAGAEYGLRWLTQILQSSECDTCETGSLTVRLVCPPADGSDDTLGEWTSYEVALTDGPREVQKYAPAADGADTDVLAGCRDVVFVEFTMTAGNPFLYKPAETVASFTVEQAAECTDICEFLFGGPGDAHCVSVSPPTLGVLGSIFTLTSADGFGALLLEAYAECSSAGEPVGDPTLQIALSEIPAGSTVVVDSSRRTLTITDADGVTSDATYLVELPEASPIQWLQVANCDAVACLCVRSAVPCADGMVDVVVQTQAREG